MTNNHQNRNKETRKSETTTQTTRNSEIFWFLGFCFGGCWSYGCLVMHFFFSKYRRQRIQTGKLHQTVSNLNCCVGSAALVGQIMGQLESEPSWDGE